MSTYFLCEVIIVTVCTTRLLRKNNKSNKKCCEPLLTTHFKNVISIDSRVHFIIAVYANTSL